MAVPEDNAKLAADISAAVKAYDAADASRREKAIIAGELLAEAQKRHPSEKAFEKFLATAGGIQIRRAQDLIAFAIGRKNFEQHQAENAAAQQRHRNKLKAEKVESEKAKAEVKRADAAKVEQRPGALRNAASPEKISVENLARFQAACRAYLPLLSAPDLKAAVAFVRLNTWRSKSRKAA